MRSSIQWTMLGVSVSCASLISRTIVVPRFPNDNDDRTYSSTWCSVFFGIEWSISPSSIMLRHTMSLIMSTRHSFLQFFPNLSFSFPCFRLGFQNFARNARYSQLTRSTSDSRIVRSRSKQFGETRAARSKNEEKSASGVRYGCSGTFRCTHGRRRARDGMAGTSASGRCSYHLVAEPYHPPGHHPSTDARSLPPPVPQE